MSHATPTKESRLLKAAAYDTYGTPVPPTTNGEPRFTLTFTKQEADTLASLCDVTLKAAGLPAAQAVECWMRKVRDAMLPPA